MKRNMLEIERKKRIKLRGISLCGSYWEKEEGNIKRNMLEIEEERRG